MFLYLYLCIGLTVISGQFVKEKRLLLNEGDVNKQELLSIQKEIQTVKTKLVQCDTMQNELKELRMKTESMQIIINKLQQQKQQSPVLGSTIYTVWWRKVCPGVNGTNMIYSGKMAGKHFNELGSGTNMLCLPHDPESTLSDFPSSLFHGYSGRLWGSEYQFNYRKIAVNDDAPCAVCHVEDGTSVLMIPAKRSCPSRWKVQYKGFLIGSWTDEHASEYVCMEDNPEYFEGTRGADLNGRTLDPIRGSCGTLPCPPYISDQFISCVVCSK